MTIAAAARRLAALEKRRRARRRPLGLADLHRLLGDDWRDDGPDWPEPAEVAENPALIWVGLEWRPKRGTAAYGLWRRFALARLSAVNNLRRPDRPLARQAEAFVGRGNRATDRGLVGPDAERADSLQRLGGGGAGPRNDALCNGAGEADAPAAGPTSHPEPAERPEVASGLETASGGPERLPPW